MSKLAQLWLSAFHKMFGKYYKVSNVYIPNSKLHSRWNEDRDIYNSVEYYQFPIWADLAFENIICNTSAA